MRIVKRNEEAGTSYTRLLLSIVMKITVTIEVEPNEVPLATELLKTVRAMTDSVNVRGWDPTLPRQSVASSPIAVPIVQTPPFAEIASAPTTGVPGAGSSTCPPSSEVFAALISRLEDTGQLDVISTQVVSMLGTAPNQDAALADLLQGFMGVAFNSSLIQHGQSVMPFIYLLTRLPDPLKTKFRDLLIPKVLKFLTVKRPVDANRMEFFLYAEAFAALVKLEFVPIKGAVQTITTLLKKPENRCAAITMLGKTVELCLSLLTERCDAVTQADLRMALSLVVEDVFRYDLDYIKENLRWTVDPVRSTDASPLPAASPVGTPSDGKPVVEWGLMGQRSFRGHTGTIFAVAYDDLHNQIISSAKDSTVVTWASSGVQRERYTLSNHYTCSMDINCGTRTLMLCGVSKEVNNSPALIWFSLDETGQLVHRGTMEKDVKLISCIKALTSGLDNLFVTGESGKQPMGNRERVCLYNVSDYTAESFSSMSPVVTFEEHEDIITCLSHYPGSDTCFFSGARDSTIKLWDRRQPKSAATFGIDPRAAKDGSAERRIAAHSGMITCLDACENVLVSGGLDKVLHVWDVRMMREWSNGNFCNPAQWMHRISIDNQAVLKVAIGPTPATAAVSTLQGLYMVNLTSSAFVPATRVQDERLGDSRQAGRYHDLKWSGGRDTLFAAGDDQRVDAYITIPPSGPS